MVEGKKDLEKELEREKIGRTLVRVIGTNGVGRTGVFGENGSKSSVSRDCQSSIVTLADSYIK